MASYRKKEDENMCMSVGCEKEATFKDTIAFEDEIMDGSDELELKLCKECEDQAIEDGLLLPREERGED